MLGRKGERVGNRHLRTGMVGSHAKTNTTRFIKYGKLLLFVFVVAAAVLTAIVAVSEQCPIKSDKMLTYKEKRKL